jgi:elongator complex protein 3
VSERSQGARAPARRRSLEFDPARHRRELAAIVSEIARLDDLDARALDRIVKRHPRSGRGLFSKSEIIAGYRFLAERGEVALDEGSFVSRLRMRPVRTLSGVTPVTVLTKPYPCPGRCIFCPSDVRMPKSYLADEPGAQRAEDNRFDPYLQCWNRLAAYRATGHPVEKVELIVLGGTWSFHPERYRIWFVLRCLEALRDFGTGVDRRVAAGVAPADYRARAVRPRAPGASYNRIVADSLASQLGGGWLHESESAGWEDLRRAQRAGESAGARCVGLSVETRPDCVDPEEVRRLRRLGVTKLQLGLQSLSDRVLALNRRGHDAAASRRAIRLLRGAGFKIQAHWMPNLHGSTPDEDLADFERLFADPAFRPDELKIYPCVLVESAELAAEWERGAWRPYGDEELAELLAGCLARTPSWCRVTRVIRDFSAADIAAGSRTANLREVAERRLGGTGRDIRAREVRGRPVVASEVARRVVEYESSVGRELFLEATTPDDRLAGFLRLCLPAPGSRPCVDELEGSALVREVHVYGPSLGVGRRPRGEAQHAGLGGALVADAARSAAAAGFADLAVISAVGTRPWYRRLGFRDGPLYQHRALAAAPD